MLPPSAWPSTAPTPAPMRALVFALFSQPTESEAVITSPGRAKHVPHIFDFVFISILRILSC